MKTRGLSSNPLDRLAARAGLAAVPSADEGEGKGDAEDIGDAVLDLSALEDVAVKPTETRRKLPKSRTGTFHNPYPRVDGRDTIKTSFNFGVEERRELDAFFARLGPRRRNLWTERVLVRAARAAMRAMDRGEGR